MAVARKNIVNVGDVSPHHQQIKVVEEYYEYTKSNEKNRSRRFLIVKCDICSLDSELWGDGCFRQSLDDFMRGTLPCECSEHPKRTEAQWQIILRRAAEKVGLEYRGYVGEWRGHPTKVILYCKKHEYEYRTGTAGNLGRGRQCPKCAHDIRTMKTTRPDHLYIDEWEKSGAYPKGTSFNRLSSRLWEVRCPFCIGEVFISDRANISAGKRPCNCTGGGGYNKALSGYVYILKVDGLYNRFTGFGISNFFNKRLAEHTRSLNKEGLSVVDSCDYFFEDGSIPLDIEKAIKYKFPLARQEIVGFKTEATHYDLFLDVRDFVEDCIENVAK